MTTAGESTANGFRALLGGIDYRRSRFVGTIATGEDSRGKCCPFPVDGRDGSGRSTGPILGRVTCTVNVLLCDHVVGEITKLKLAGAGTFILSESRRVVGSATERVEFLRV